MLLDTVQNDPLDVPATPEVLRRLAAAGVLGPEALAHALSAVEARPTPASWYAFARRQLLTVGASLAAAGVVFFVAANWDALQPLARMAAVAAAMASAMIAAAVLGLRTLPGQIAMLLGGALFGPLLALYGQAYQTGADAWELFALWALVATGHVLLARLAPAWIAWLGLVHVAALLWGEQVLGGHWLAGERGLAVVALAVFDVAVVALAERLLPSSERAYLARSAALLAAALTSAVGMEVVFELEPDTSQWLCLLMLVAGWAGLAAVYRRRKPDLFMLFVLATSVLGVASSFLAFVLFEILQLDDAGPWFLGILICVEVWALTRWLLLWRARHDQAAQARGISGGTV